MALALSIALGVIVFGCIAFALRQTQSVGQQRFAHDFALLKAEQSALEARIATGDTAAQEAGQARNELRRRVLALRRLADAAPTLRDRPVPLAIAGVAIVLIIFLALYSLETQGQDVGPAPTRPVLDKERGGLGNLTDFDALLKQGQQRFASGNFGGAFDAYAAASAVAPDRIEGWLAQGEALVSAEQGEISPAAMLAFARAEQASPGNPISQYYAGLERLQQGDAAAAQAIWRALKARSRPTAPWMTQVERGLEIAAQRLGQEAEPEVGLDQIQAMVAGLAARLEEEPDDPQGWLMLARSYAVLGRGEAAKGALNRFEELPDVSAELAETAAKLRVQLTQK